MLELSREHVHESGYVYAKGKSRSKMLNPTTEKQPPREKVDKRERDRRIQSIVEQVDDIKKRI